MVDFQNIRKRRRKLVKGTACRFSLLEYASSTSEVPLSKPYPDCIGMQDTHMLGNLQRKIMAIKTNNLSNRLVFLAMKQNQLIFFANGHHHGSQNNDALRCVRQPRGVLTSFYGANLHRSPRLFCMGRLNSIQSCIFQKVAFM